jgi:predicted permease
VSLASARAAVDVVAAQLLAEHPSRYPSGTLRLSLSTLADDVVSEVKPALSAVAAAVAFVLLVACSNLTNLLLARASARSRELAVRVSIGASRPQIVRQLATESLLVGGLGAAAGLLIAQWGVHGLLQLAPPTLPRREAIGVDGAAAAFAVIASLACALVVSLVAAWHATNSDVTRSLKQDPASSRGGATVRGLLAAGQLALSLVLLIGAGLMVRAFISIRAVPLGFDPDRAISMGIELQRSGFGTGSFDEARAYRLAFYRRLTDAVRQIPGVELAGAGYPAPLRDEQLIQRFSTGPADPERQAAGFIALAGYLEALRVPLRSGRYFTPDDDQRHVAIVDEHLAREVWPGESPLGKRLIVPLIGRQQPVEIVGVVAHVQTEGLRAPGLPQLWMTYATRSYTGLVVVARGSAPESFVPAIRDIVGRLGAGRPIHHVRLLDDVVSDASSDTRFALFVLAVFAGLALGLSAIGLYAVVSYATARRTREIAVRLALGADARRIVALVVRQGASWIVAGLVAGTLAARLFARYLSALLFDVAPTDPATFVFVAAGLAAIAIVATAIPAIRAVRIDPMLSLRAE